MMKYLSNVHLNGIWQFTVNKRENKMGNLDLMPGMESFFQNEDDDKLVQEDVVPSKGYFDAAKLPDAPGYQANEAIPDTFVLFIVFPSQEEMRRALEVFTEGKRKSLLSKTKKAIIDSTRIRKDGLTWLQWWEKTLKTKSNDKSVDIEEEIADDLDEAQIPEN